MVLSLIFCPGRSLIVKYLPGKLFITFCDLAVRIIFVNADAGGACLRDPDGEGDAGIHDPDRLSVAFPEHLGDVLRVICPEVDHRQQDSFDLQGLVQPFLHDCDGLQKLLKAFDRQVSSLDGYQDAIGGDKRIYKEVVPMILKIRESSGKK